jgi:beta-1,4-mannosyl-glycoprotein beta-1,4-N-acetylglucosaminyltransferase
MKIIDCFIYYNEEDLLNYRLNILNDYVDYFILVESTMTHVGKSKKLFYNENKHLFENFNDKIIHIVVDLPYNEYVINIEQNDQWKNENFQRNSIKLGIDKLNLNSEDIILVSDVDEIPDYNILKQIKNSEIDLSNNIKCFEEDLYYYNLNSKLCMKWYHSKILSYKKYLELGISFNDIRFYSCDKIINSGWHLSCFGDANFIKNKLENFSHQEYNNIDHTDINIINNRIDNLIDVVGRKEVKIIKISIHENNYLPHNYDKYLNKYIL